MRFRCICIYVMFNCLCGWMCMVHGLVTRLHRCIRTVTILCTMFVFIDFLKVRHSLYHSPINAVRFFLKKIYMLCIHILCVFVTFCHVLQLHTARAMNGYTFRIPRFFVYSDKLFENAIAIK